LERLAAASVAEASTHPNFAMGQRITIDSATMFNKAMEVIEAREFFGLNPGQIEVILQREQIIHALVAFADGAVMAHMGAPDMRHPIGYALNWPERAHLPVARLDLAALGKLTFEAPDPRRYPALALARAVMQAGGAAGAVFNAAKEIALDHFIAGAIGFLDMAAVVEDTLAHYDTQAGLSRAPTGLADVLEIDAAARRIATEAALSRAGHRLA
jgi:1-deoxy-D-xylulose-5-phosphate reductoisomerase